MKNLPNHVSIREVGPRDGLQNEDTFIRTYDKVAWIEKLIDSGTSYIEITSFVSPKWIPALKDAKETAAKVKHKKDVTFAALVPNRKGAEAAIEAGMDELSVFMSASETHNKRNINKTIKETYPVLKEVIQEGKKANKTIRSYISTSFVCPYEGKVEIDKVLSVACALLEMGVDELSIGDTVGAASPRHVDQLLSVLLKKVTTDKIAMHFHNTYGMAAANCLASLQRGIHKLDSSCGGLGGCPYAPGAAGNMATEELLYLLHQMGIQTGMREEKIWEAAAFIERKLGRSLDSNILKVRNAGIGGI
ncbi:hydroxymethylglutaryl-CoA lyase [Alteribacillus iranensis]|uniref:Hydroxymethylglutaryl-CoA lyase n=1 Tax=Alteribacillus iranensis TaxID=930128 RepID=A0A1I2E6J9_9BACI|nr:hydroxymethylglutaryl-CoA lyase [Alteribacillus iranensis]SFE88323.1 hydroxymethylglutaryl-CoA lyase [Alteribacillus iranensis]